MYVYISDVSNVNIEIMRMTTKSRQKQLINSVDYDTFEYNHVA